MQKSTITETKKIQQSGSFPKKYNIVIALLE